MRTRSFFVSPVIRSAHCKLAQRYNGEESFAQPLNLSRNALRNFCTLGWITAMQYG